MKPNESESSIEAPDAERRQLTIVFCDVVGHTQILEELGEEPWDEMLLTYYDTVREAVEYFGGRVAELLADGVVAWFGYPRAREDDAERAVQAGLKIIEAFASSRVEFEAKYGKKLEVRIGIHTGSVLIEKSVSVKSRATGVATIVAFRIQNVAEPDTVLISEATHSLVNGFQTEDPPRPNPYQLKGITEPVRLYRVVRATDSSRRFDAVSAFEPTPFVGRERETALLVDRWKLASKGSGQVVLVEGEAGIGKSRLLRAFRDCLDGEPRWEEFRASSLHTNSAFYPLAELIEQSPGLGVAQSMQDAGVPLAEVAHGVATQGGLQRKQKLDGLVKWFSDRARREPAVFVFENLHWLDSSTLGLIELLIGKLQHEAALLLLTCRPNFEPSWPDQPHVAQISLRPLTHDDTKTMIGKVAGDDDLSRSVLEQLAVRTDGLPLYIEELTRSVLESGLLADDRQTTQLPGFSIPASLRDSLMARLDRLGPAKTVAQLASVLGRDFSRELLAGVATDVEPEDLERDLASLVDAGVLVLGRTPENERYSFRHALIQDTACGSTLEATRKTWHARAAQVIEQGFPKLAAAEPERLAKHCEQGELYDKAVGYYEKAAEQARHRFAVSEANTHLKQGIRLIEKLPEGPSRSERKLDLQVQLALNTVASEGFGAATSTSEYERARDLCKRIGDLPLDLEFVVIRGLIQANVGKSRLGAAQAHIDELRRLSRKADHPSWRLLSHAHLGMLNHLRGNPAEALREFAEANALYERDPDQHRELIYRHGAELGVLTRVWTGWSAWIRGYPDQAKQSSQAAVDLAKKTYAPSSASPSEPHPYTGAYANVWATIVHWMRREPEQATEFAKQGLEIAMRHGLWFFVAYGMLVKPWVDLQNATDPESKDRAIQEMQSCVSRINEDMAIGAFRPRLLGYFADSLMQAGRFEQAMTNVQLGIDYVEETLQEEWEAELHRLKGELLLKTKTPDEEQAVAEFQRAIEIAGRQQAKSLELRAAVSLARFWNEKGQFDRAAAALGPVYDWFTEGHDTADLVEARAVLERARAGGM